MPDCSPSYDYQPTFVTTGVTCATDGYEETRGRTAVGLGGTFFRTKNSGAEQDLISIELIYDGVTEYWTLIVRDDGITVEVFGGSPPTIVGDQTPDLDGECTPNLIPTLRSLVNGNSDYIEMPELDYGGERTNTPIFDVSETLLPGGGDANCLSPFPETFFTGGEGGPSSGPTISGTPPQTQPRTGPERTIYIVTQTEIVSNTPADDGRKYDPPMTTKRQQWNGSEWIPYVPNADCV